MRDCGQIPLFGSQYCSSSIHIFLSICISLPGLRRRKWQPNPVFLSGESRGQRSLAGHSPGGCKELDTTEQPAIYKSQSHEGGGRGQVTSSKASTQSKALLGPCISNGSPKKQPIGETDIDMVNSKALTHTLVWPDKSEICRASWCIRFR